MDPISPDVGAVDIHAEASGVQAFSPFCFVLGTTAAYLESRWVCVRDSESSTTAAYNMSSGRAEQTKVELTTPHVQLFRQTMERSEEYNLAWDKT